MYAASSIHDMIDNYNKSSHTQALLPGIQEHATSQ